MPSWTTSYCARCGAAIDQSTTGRPRRFCSAACKQAQYRVTKVNRKGYSKFEGTNTQTGRVTPSPAKPGKPARTVTP